MDERYSDISDLSQFFPWRAKVREHELPRLLELLSRSDDNTSDGSSFAVTTGPGLRIGERFLWLSELSDERLRWAALSPGTGAVSTDH